MVRYIVTVGEHVNHIFQNGELILPERLKRGGFRVSNAVVLYSIREDADRDYREKIISSVNAAREGFESLGIPVAVMEVRESYLFQERIEEFKALIVPDTVINITGGRRIVGYELLYAAVLVRNENLSAIRSVFYVTERGAVIELPVIGPEVQLTPLEFQILKVAKWYVNKRGRPATITELRDRLEFINNTTYTLSFVSEYVSRLEKKGYVRKQAKGKRKFVVPLV